MAKYLRWIPVTERLPNEELVAYNEKYGEHECVGVIVLIKDAKVPYHLYWNGDYFVDENGEEYDVTHWMQMPPHPKDCLINMDLDEDISANYEEIEVLMLAGGVQDGV